MKRCPSPVDARCLLVLAALAVVTQVCVAADSASARKVTYNRDVRPILADTCFACPGPDSASRQADLRLDREADATAAREGGNPAITKGKLEASELIARITSTDPDAVMPPPSTKKTLTPQQIDTLKLWIEQGAEYEKHWSLI